MRMEHELKTVRVYNIGPDYQGYRILVDRLWPRGLCKEVLEPFWWAKDMAPSTQLRKWFGHDPEHFEAFAASYYSELDANPGADTFVEKVSALLEEQDVLLLFAAKSETVNHAVVLKKWLLERIAYQRNH